MIRVNQVVSPEEFVNIPKADLPEYLKEIPDLTIDLKDMSVGVWTEEIDSHFLGYSQYYIEYKGIPLWRTILPLEKIRIVLPEPSIIDEEDPNSGKEPYTIICIDRFGDFYTYGYWKTLEELKAWLKSPKSLY